MFGKIKKTKGITLISLIITIIIMLILATIAINVIIGDRGLFKKAKAAIDIHKKAAVQEELQIAVDNGYAEEKTNKLKVAEDMEKDCPGIEWVYKSSLAGKYKGYDFTVINEEVVMDKLEDNSNTIINGYDNKLYFWNETYNNSIKNITFKIDNLSNYNTNAVLNENNEYRPWNVSQKKDNSSIIAYLEKIGETDTYNLYIVSDKKIEFPEDSTNMLADFYAVENVSGFENIDTSNVLSMNQMFSFLGYDNMTSLDLGNNLDTSSVIDMNDMFSGCGQKKMTSLKLNIDTSSCVSMSSMFEGCGMDLDLGYKFNTSNVTDMSYMFAGCGNLRSLDLSSFNTSNVTNMVGMFNACNLLTELNLGDKFNTLNVTDMAAMFNSCNLLTELNLGDKFNTSNVTDMSYMFYDCKKLTSLDLSNFNTSNVINMSHMFENCNCLQNLNLGSKFDTSKVTDMSYMFDSCSLLTELNLGDKFKTSNVTDMQHMFHYCRSLTSLDLSKFDTSKVTDMRDMFAECNNMHSLILGSQFSISNCEIKEEATTQHSYDNMFDNFATSATETNTCTIKCTQKVQDTINKLITNTNVVTFDSIS